MTIKKRVKVLKDRFDKIFPYNVQVYKSFDGGKSYYYCGIGRFCKNTNEVKTYIAEVMNK